MATRSAAVTPFTPDTDPAVNVYDETGIALLDWSVNLVTNTEDTATTSEKLKVRVFNVKSNEKLTSVGGVVLGVTVVAMMAADVGTVTTLLADMSVTAVCVIEMKVLAVVENASLYCRIEFQSA